MKGSFSEDALEQFARLAAEKQGLDFSEGEVYDFARCVRSDGSFYGTGGKCRKGTEAGEKEKDDERSRSSEVRTRPRGAIESDIRALRQKSKGRGLEAVKANTEIKKLEAELAKPLKGGNRDKMTATPGMAAKVKAAKEKLKSEKAANGGKRTEAGDKEEEAPKRTPKQENKDYRREAQTRQRIRGELAREIAKKTGKSVTDPEVQNEAVRRLDEMRGAPVTATPGTAVRKSEQ